MTGKTRVHHKLPAGAYTVIEPRRLGRQYHRIPEKIKELFASHPRLIGDYLLSHYRTALELAGLHVRERVTRAPDCYYRCQGGRVGFGIDRGLLNVLLERYYGGTPSQPPRDQAGNRSEQRLRDRLAVELIETFLRALLAGDSLGGLQRTEQDYADPPWEYVVELAHAGDGVAGSLLFYFDAELADELVRRLGQPARAAAASVDPAESLRALPVKLDCVLAELSMPLAQVLALEPGDVIPIRALDRCEVRISRQAYFRGAVFEADGALCVTSLEPVTSP